MTRSPRGWEFRPDPGIARLHSAIQALLAGVSLVGAGLFWGLGGDMAGVFLGVPLALFALVLLAHAARGWRLRSTALVVEESGRVRYGDQELCPAGSVESVRVEPDPDSDGDDHKVRLGLTAGAVVDLPAPFFDSFLDWKLAGAFAEEFARALNAGIDEPA